MSDRGFLFLFSVLMIVGGIATTGWLFATGQAGTVDGLFLALTALLIAAAFGLYLKFMIGRAMEAASTKAPAQPAKSGAAAPAAKPSPATASQA
jgi:hypothetical protein